MGLAMLSKKAPPFPAGLFQYNSEKQLLFYQPQHLNAGAAPNPHCINSGSQSAEPDVLLSWLKFYCRQNFLAGQAEEAELCFILRLNVTYLYLKQAVLVSDGVRKKADFWTADGSFSGDNHMNKYAIDIRNKILCFSIFG